MGTNSFSVSMSHWPARKASWRWGAAHGNGDARFFDFQVPQAVDDHAVQDRPPAAGFCLEFLQLLAGHGGIALVIERLRSASRGQLPGDAEKQHHPRRRGANSPGATHRRGRSVGRSIRSCFAIAGKMGCRYRTTPVASARIEPLGSTACTPLALRPARNWQPRAQMAGRQHSICWCQRKMCRRHVAKAATVGVQT